MIITMAQRKGGSGKSTIAINLAVEMASRGFKVGILDTDPQQTAKRWFKRRLKNSESDTDKFIEVRDVLGSIEDSITGMAKRNDHLIIDTAGFHSNEMRDAVIMSHVALAPFRPKQYDLEQCDDLMLIFKKLKYANPKLYTAAVITSASTNHKDNRAATAAEVLTGRGYIVLETKVCHRESYGDTSASGKGAAEFVKEDKKAADEIAALATEIFGDKKNEQAANL